MGDCLIPDFALAFAAFLRIFLARSPGVVLDMGGAADESSSISRGELVVTTLCSWSNMARGSDWACRAGEVRGLK
jgi:hypothetical protein